MSEFWNRRSLHGVRKRAHCAIDRRIWRVSVEEIRNLCCAGSSERFAWFREPAGGCAHGSGRPSAPGAVGRSAAARSRRQRTDAGTDPARLPAHAGYRYGQPASTGRGLVARPDGIRFRCRTATAPDTGNQRHSSATAAAAREAPDPAGRLGRARISAARAAEASIIPRRAVADRDGSVRGRPAAAAARRGHPEQGGTGSEPGGTSIRAGPDSASTRRRPGAAAAITVAGYFFIHASGAARSAG